MSKQSGTPSFDQIELAVFSGRLNAICEEMGFVLMRSALSPNIKDRLDFSCAFFDVAGNICAQAAHIPVHLGSMAYAMRDIVSRFDWFDGDVVILNDPFLGGTHLPDVTVISPFFYQNELLGFFANRAHHANIGSSSPGSMPISSSIAEEGVLIQPVKLFERGKLNATIAEHLAVIESDPDKSDMPGDFLAQISANRAGFERLGEWLDSLDNAKSYLLSGLDSLNDYGERLAKIMLSKLPHKTVEFTDYMDDDGFGAEKIPIKVRLDISHSGIIIDFEGTSKQVQGNLNCPLSVSAAAVYYVIICLLPDYAPHCQGVFNAVKISAPKGCLVNAEPDAAVAAGNVETSMRIVDVLLGALDRIGVSVPAGAQGTMNNVALGGLEGDRWDYYETIAGGMGGSERYAGQSGVQCHMTNTLNTPVESLEMHYPLRIREYAIRDESGGRGVHNGGNGIVRAYEFVRPTSVTLLTERRLYSPAGTHGGEPGLPGSNEFNGEQVPPKIALRANQGDILKIQTPGGGGWGAVVANKPVSE